MARCTPLNYTVCELVVSKLTTEKIVDLCVCGLHVCCMRHEEENE